jgi:hypothetical protein
MRQTFVLILTFFILSQAGCGSGEPRPPGKFGACYAQIKEDMTEEEVDAILTGYPKKREKHISDQYSMRAKHLKRPSIFRDEINDNPDPKEYDFFIYVYYDEAYRVVGKEWSEYAK